MKKKIISVILAGVLVISCFAMCGCESHKYDDAAAGFQNAADSLKNSIERYS